MKSKPFLPKFIAALTIAIVSFASLAPARADTIAENTGGVGQTLSPFPFFYGQSFTTTSLVPETNITFNFFTDAPPTTPYAIGTGFLLSTQYIGTPNNLSSSTPGYLGQANASGGFYSFGSGVTLQALTQYFFYENAGVPSGTLSGGNIYPGGHLYVAPDGNTNYSNNEAQSFNFRVTGTPVSNGGNGVPETGNTALLLGVAFVGLLGVRRFFVGGSTADH